jgi:hypothetical protein
MLAQRAVVDHAKVINANVSKLRATGYLADRPNPRRCGLQALIHLDESTVSHFNAGQLESDIFCVRYSASRDQQMSGL